jgi:hypothetical protein
MQTLNQTTNSLLETIPTHLLEVLQDIAANVTIGSDFSIAHSHYKPLELSADVIPRFQRLPIELQHKYLNLQLRSFLYGIYYNGSLRETLALTNDTTNKKRLPNWENNTFLGINLEFCDRLHQSNCGEGYYDDDWQVLRLESDGTLAVKKGELTLHIDRTLHLTQSQQLASVGEIVSVKMPRNLMQNGFYMAIGDREASVSKQANPDAVTVRIYFNLTPEGAIAVMEDLTRQLNEKEIPFHFKVLYNPSDYNRYDSGVLYCDRLHYPLVRQILESIYRKHRSQFKPSVPLFTKLLAPGLALAEEPNQKFAERESFGMNRCQIVANGFLQAWNNGETSPEMRLMAIAQNFSSLGIKLDRSFLNANSEDVYLDLFRFF